MKKNTVDYLTQRNTQTKKEFFSKLSTCSRGHQLKAKMNSSIFNQLQLVSCSYLNNVVVNCFPVGFLDGFNFSVLKAVLKTLITTLNLLIQT